MLSVMLKHCTYSILGSGCILMNAFKQRLIFGLLNIFVRLFTAIGLTNLNDSNANNFYYVSSFIHMGIGLII
jgi:hypothetical protein